MTSAPTISDPVLLFDRSDRLLMQFTGPKAAESLTGLVTNDVLGLRGGDGQYACALTAKGRIIADVRILAVAGEGGAIDRLLVDTSAAAGVGFAGMIRKYVNPRTARYADLSMSTSCLTVAGDGALALLQGAAEEPERLSPLIEGGRFTHREVAFGGVAARVVVIPDLGSTPALDLHVAAEQAASLLARLVECGAVVQAMSEWHRRRVLAGWPEWGQDMDEGTLAQEANMDALQAISYRKGCYTGQETVARVHFRGHVNRTLRKLWFDDGSLPAPGTSLTGESDAVVGDTRSSALVGDGRGTGIAMVRREVPDGAELRWMDGGGVSHLARVDGGVLGG
jgi:folate-binding protein YgfZ